MAARQYYSHSSSRGWVPLKNLFLEHKDEFLTVHAEQRFSEKYKVGMAMWDWMRRTGLVEPELQRLAEEIHHRRTKEKFGLPLWYLAFREALRNTPKVDALIVEPQAAGS
jgi:hypothetical protein